MKTRLGNVILGAMVCVMAVVNFASAVSASTSTQLFFDDFTGTALDTSRWSVFVDIHGVYHWPYVAGGLLHSQGYHTRIDSIPTFAPMGQSVMARARIRLAGEDHKFGFGVNPNERAGPINGYYFDTYDLQAREHYVRAVAGSNPGDGSLINLLDVEIPVTWCEFHEFAIERTPSEVIFSIDGLEVTRVADAFAGALPVGVWNDRWSLMQTDWVEVCRSELSVSIDIDPDTLNLGSKEKWVTCYIELPDGYNVMDIDGSTVMLEGIPAYIGAEGWARAGANSGNIMDHDGDGILERMVKFDGGAVRDYLIGLGASGYVGLTVTGDLVDGPSFEGIDVIRVIK